MAITSDFEAFGVTFQNAYTKIKNVEYNNGTKEEWILSEDPLVAPTREVSKVLRVKYTYVTLANATSDQPISTKEEHVVFETGENLVEQCYTHLKTLEAFADAVDA